MIGRHLVTTASFVMVLLVSVGPARADAIDGNWCYSDGRSMSIDGPQIVTPGGKRMTGNYNRHAFTYVAPKGEPGAGSMINMILIDEDTLNLTVGGSSAEPRKGKVQVWRRCDLTT